MCIITPCLTTKQFTNNSVIFRYGRSLAIFYGALLTSACTVIMCISYEMWTIFAMRFLMGIFVYVIIIPSITLGTV